MKKHNFYAGPSIMSQFTIDNTIEAIRDFAGTGLSILEISHRSKEFVAVMDEAQALFKELGGKVKDGVHRRQDQKGMLLVLGWIVAIAPIDSIGRMNGIVAEGRDFIMCSYPAICLINKRGPDLGSDLVGVLKY